MSVNLFGTNPNQVPLNSHLGDLAYQSYDGTILKNVDVQSGIMSGTHLGIGSLSNLTVTQNVSIASTLGIGSFITITPYDTLNSGTLSFDGSSGQLFSITNNLTSGSIFSVNDISGIPSIDVDANGTVHLAGYGGKVGIGTTNPTTKLDVIGGAYVSGDAKVTGNLSIGGTNFNAGFTTASAGRFIVDNTVTVLGVSTTLYSLIGGTTPRGPALAIVNAPTVGTDLSVSVLSFSSINAGGYNSTSWIANLATPGSEGDLGRGGTMVFGRRVGNNSAETLRLTRAGNVGIGTSAPGQLLELGGQSSPRIALNGNSGGASAPGVLFQSAGVTYSSILLNNVGSGELAIKAGAAGQNAYFITFGTNDGTERARIDSSGRLLVGTSAAQSGTRSQYSKFTVQGNNQTTSDGAQVNLATNTNAPSLSTGDTLGQVIFTDNGPGEYGKIACQMDGASAGTNDYPGALLFSTTADGAATPTERMRIDSSGRLHSPSYLNAGNVNCWVLRSQPGSTDATAAVETVTSALGERFALAMRNGATTGNASGNLEGSISYSNLLLNISARDTLVLKTAAAERARIDSSGRLLVGTSSYYTVPDALFGSAHTLGAQIRTGEGYGGLDIISSTSNVNNRVAEISLSREGSSGAYSAITTSGRSLGAISFNCADGAKFVRAASIVAYLDGTGATDSAPGRLVFSTTADGAASPTEAMRINNQRELLIGTTTRTANGGVLQISNGITFPGTQSACSDANTLDDYEEGTFTPTVTAGITSPTYNTGTTRGTYRKIGALVYFTLRVTLTAGTTSATTLQIGGLPFAIAASIEYRVAFHGNFQVGASTASVTAVGYNSVSYMDILNSGSGAVISGTTATNTMDLQITGSYPV